MKKLLLTLALVALATTFAFSQLTVNDNTGTNGKTGIGTFKCLVITPLSIAPLEAAGLEVDLGQFVVNTTTAYTNTSTNWPATDYMEFKVSGEFNHGFYYTITEDLGTTGGNTITLAWTAGDAIAPTGTAGLTANSPGTLNALGDYYIRATVASVKAMTSTGTTPVTFVQQVTVSYNF